MVGEFRHQITQLQGGVSLFSSISDQALFLTDLVDFLAVKPRIQSKPNAILAPRPIRAGFEFRNVSFQYPGTSRLVLDRLNFHIEPGEHIALVGENGQGKDDAGEIDGPAVRSNGRRDPAGWRGSARIQRGRSAARNRRHLQDFVRYDMPARMNIGVGRIEETDHDDALWTAAKKARADRTIERLESGLDQMLGRRFEGGVDLSGGEWQKIALARAYLRDAQVLILDEPTAALDAVAEAEVFARFAELAKNRTAILISHRFSTVRKAGRIVVLEGGRIREQGTHDQLVTIRGRYARLFELQAANYR